MSNKNDVIFQNLIAALSHEDETLVQAKAAVDQALVKWEIASRKFAAIRDLVTEHMGSNPYLADISAYKVPLPSEGKYAFLNMNPGDAAHEALRYRKNPMTLSKIVEFLKAGGMDWIDARTINASLMNRSGVKKLPDAHFQHEDEKGG